MGGRAGSGRGGGGESALAAGVRLLAARALSAGELRERLARRGFQAPEIDSAVSSLVARRYLDDNTLAYNIAASRVNALFGRSRVAADLGRRGLDPATIAQAIALAFAEVDEDDLARRASRKLLGCRATPDDERAAGRLARALLRRGFSRGAVMKAVGIAAGPGSLLRLRGPGARPRRGGAGRARLENLESDDDELETDP